MIGQTVSHADDSRHLGAFDPFRREMTLSLGCALEDMVLAAEAEGFRPSLELAAGALRAGGRASPGGPMATLRLAPGEPRATDLYRAIPHGHIDRGAYDPRPIASPLLDQLRAHATEDVAIFVYDQGAKKARKECSNLAPEVAGAFDGRHMCLVPKQVEPGVADGGRRLRHPLPEELVAGAADHERPRRDPLRASPLRRESRGGFPRRSGSDSLFPRQASGQRDWANRYRWT